MQISQLLNYPEFILAAVASIVIIFALIAEQEWHWPQFLVEPAVSCLLLCPSSYITWIEKSLIQTGWRGSYSLSDFAGWKIYLPLLSLLLAFVLSPYIVLTLAVILFFVPDIVLYFS